MEDVVVIELKTRMVVLKLQAFDGDIDIESILKIDYANILGEILTFPVVFNRIATMRAEMTNIVALAKLDFELFEAQVREEKQKQLAAVMTKRPTVDDIATAVMRDNNWQAKKRQLLAREKDMAYVESLYWSAQSKDTKLNRLSEKIRPEEFEKDILEDTINGVMIKVTKKSIS